MVDFANDIMKLIYDEYQSGEEAKKDAKGEWRSRNTAVTVSSFTAKRV